MTDKEIFERLKALVDNRKVKDRIDEVQLFDTINNISDINYEEGDNFLTLILRWGHYAYTGNDENLDIFKRAVDLLHKKGINKKYKRGTYNAPVLFFVTNSKMFEYLCKNGYDPDERINTGMQEFDGYPYLALHNQFNKEIYCIAKAYGFDPYYKMPQGTTLHLLIKSYLNKISAENLEFILAEFKELVNVEDAEGFTILHYFAISIFFDYEEHIDWLNLFLQYNCDKSLKTKKELIFRGGEGSVKEGSTALDILTGRIKANDIKTTLISDKAKILLQ